MEVDPPTSSSNPVQQTGATLKRSNSAPMINMLVTTQAEPSPPSSFKPGNSTAIRRLSSSNMMLNNSPASTSPPIRGPDRVARIKQEESHIADRERQHEREIQSSFWISNNWDNLSFEPGEPMDGQHRRPRSFSESLHIMTQSNILCGSPSPTRAASKQCFSPSMQIPVKNTTYTPSPSPSPTRKNFLRSLSPIALKKSSLSLKRKMDGEGGERWDYLSPPKKFNTGASTPDRAMTCDHPLAHSISSSSLDGSSPEQMVPRIGGLGMPSHPLGGRSPHSLGHHSPLSTGSGGHSPHGPIPSTLTPTSKQAYLFRPVTGAVTGAVGSPSSSSSCSSSSSSSHPHGHLNPHHTHLEGQQQPQSGGQVAHSDIEGQHQPMSSDSGDTSHSGNDVYMADSEMREPADILVKGEGTVGFNFKPISPDHV